MKNRVALSLAIALLAGCGDSRSALGTAPAAIHGAHAPGRTGALRVLYSFTGGNDGGNAATSLVLDRSGNLYGTTVVGGTYACGTVFTLTAQAGVPWPETILYDFGCYADGKSPHGGVIFDRRGNLYGTTVAGGSGGSCTSDGCGIVYRLTPSAQNVLHDFTAGTDGFGPGGGVVFDRAGNLYGTTPDGGAHSEGTIYEVIRGGRSARERVIHAFSGGNDGGAGSLGSPMLDAAGNLFGVTEIGGAHGAGTAYELSRVAARWKITTLYAFAGTPDAGSPYGGLIADKTGNLYGTTYYGGTNGLGAIFELVAHRGKYRERLVYSFAGGADGSAPTSALAFGSSGRLYGTTSAGGGTCDCGTIFVVDARSGKESVLHGFGGGADGAYPYYGLARDAAGNMFGTTVAGGSFNQGTVFELSGA